ncbi:hypothetical protein KFE25_000006 [Diacronema lutheri]|uniref:Uncharacterized protein n=1 Tax=Diacronema lutheri TaxID=2081491 RepID=A0A8J6CDS3_DIALT|nr:hypothetical protein KFE25_000006 [Diacronema lutheri]
MLRRVLHARVARTIAPRPVRALCGIPAAPQPTPRELYEQIVQRFETRAMPPRAALHKLLLDASTPDDAALAVSAFRMYTRKDRPPLRAETTAILLKAALRTRQFEPVVEMLEGSKWYGLAPTEAQLQPIAVALEQERDWPLLERLWRVRVALELVSSVEAVRAAQRALLEQGKLQAALRMLRAERLVSHQLVKPYMYAAVLGACADTKRHAQARIAWSQLLASGLEPTTRCLVEAMRALLTADEGGAAEASALFASATDPAAEQRPRFDRAEALAAAALKLPAFTAEHLAPFGGDAAVVAVVALDAAASPLPESMAASAAAADSDAQAETLVEQPEREAAPTPAGRKEQQVKDGRDDSLI